MSTPTPPTAQTLSDLLDILDQDPDLQQQVQSRLIRFVRSNQIFREELRREILTEELIQLPARFTRLEEDVNVIKTDVAELKTTVGGLTSTVEDLTTTVQNLTTTVQDLTTTVQDLTTNAETHTTKIENLTTRFDRMSGQVSRLAGSDYQNTVSRVLRRAVRTVFTLESAVNVPSAGIEGETHVEGIAQNAETAGIITPQEAAELELADLIIQGNHSDNARIYIVAEASITVQLKDVENARVRAAILNRASGIDAVAAVAGADIDDEARAGLNPDVSFFQIDEDGRHITTD